MRLQTARRDSRYQFAVSMYLCVRLWALSFILMFWYCQCFMSKVGNHQLWKSIKVFSDVTLQQLKELSLFHHPPSESPSPRSCLMKLRWLSQHRHPELCTLMPAMIRVLQTWVSCGKSRSGWMIVHQCNYVKRKVRNRSRIRYIMMIMHFWVSNNNNWAAMLNI